MLEQAVGRARAARMSYDESEYWLAEFDHAQRCKGLHKALGAHLAHTPQGIRSDGDTTAAVQDNLQWQDDYDELQLALVREDCCHHLPLDDPFGEQIDPPDLDWWRDAPGVQGAQHREWDEDAEDPELL